MKVLRWTAIQIATYDYIRQNAGTTIADVHRQKFPGRESRAVFATVKDLKEAGFVGECAPTTANRRTTAIGLQVIKERV